MSNNNENIAAGRRYIYIYMYHKNKQIWAWKFSHSNTIPGKGTGHFSSLLNILNQIHWITEYVTIHAPATYTH